jgi:hypothetical protein
VEGVLQGLAGRHAETTQERRANEEVVLGGAGPFPRKSDDFLGGIAGTVRAWGDDVNA